MKTLKLTIAIGIAALLISCEEQLVGPQTISTPITNFEYYWRTFNEHYGMFQVKRINWDSLHYVFQSQVNDQLTDAELYQILGKLMIQLNDNHLNLYPTNGELPVYPGGVLRYKNDILTILKTQEDYDLKIVKKYVSDFVQLTPNIGYGTLPNNLLYINIMGTDDLSQAQKAMTKVKEHAEKATGVVLDVRGFYGGFDAVSQFMAGNFVDSKELYMVSRKRNGPNHDNFTESTNWYVEPQGNPFNKPVVVLTSRFTQSAGESFTMALKEFSHVQLVGDTTAGSFSDNPNFELPNGWIFSVSVGDYRSATGESYEGIGLAPNVFSRTTKTDLLNGLDPTFEKALTMF